MDNKEKFKSLLDHKEKNLEIEGVLIRVNKRVFDPDISISHSTKIILDNLQEVIGKSVLDVGCGTGILGIVSAKRGAFKVLCSDIDLEAVRNSEENVDKNKFKKVISVVKSDLFNSIRGKFDIILANLPILGGLWDDGESIEKLLRVFFQDAKDYLKEDGKIYFSSASFGKENILEKLILEAGYAHDLIEEEKLGENWQLYILSKNISKIISLKV